MEVDVFGPAALAALATGAGAPAWAAVLMLAVETLKGAGFPIDGQEKPTVFVLAALLEVTAFIAAVQIVPPMAELSVAGIVLAVMAWFTVARLAMALHDDKSRKPGSLLEGRLDG